MPKETVYGEMLTSTPNSDRAIVEVRWSREAGDVQVVSKCINALGGRVASDDDGIHYTDGMYVTLDRRGINDVIRHLRRARDQAFGRDE